MSSVVNPVDNEPSYAHDRLPGKWSQKPVPEKWYVCHAVWYQISLVRVFVSGLERPILLRWQFGAVGSDVGQINEVTLRRAPLVLGWVTVSGLNSHCGKFISV